MYDGSEWPSYVLIDREGNVTCAGDDIAQDFVQELVLNACDWRLVAVNLIQNPGHRSSRLDKVRFTEEDMTLSSESFRRREHCRIKGKENRNCATQQPDHRLAQFDAPIKCTLQSTLTPRKAALRLNSL